MKLISFVRNSHVHPIMLETKHKIRAKIECRGPRN